MEKIFILLKQFVNSITTMKKLVFCLIAFLLTLSGNAQTDGGKIVSSLIIALDVRPGNMNYYWDSFLVSDKLKQMLIDNEIDVDYVSGVLYGIKEGAKTPEKFARLIVEPIHSSDNYLEVTQLLHNNVPNEGYYFSITSFAKPYALMAMKDKQITNKTYMAIITDGRYNGNDDYYGEVEYAKSDFSKIGRQQFLQDIAKVQTNYFCRFKYQCEIPRGYIQLYEFIPLQQYFALESVVDFPHELTAYRTKSGYKVRFGMAEVNNKDYEVQKVSLTLYSGEKVVCNKKLKFNENLTLYLARDEVENAQIKLKAWVKFNDGIYNNTILHPNGSKLQGSDGLNRTISIKKESKAVILGIIPLSDFLYSLSFWTSSQTIAANVWGWIFIMVIILIIGSIIVIAIYKSNIYKPNIRDIKI